ncbi:flagellar basal body-associated FliL family protein [Roseobacteraceae bacterium S113]
MKKLLPILIALIGIGGGVGAGLALRPEPEMVDKDWDEAAANHADASEEETPLEEAREYVKLNNQFVVPVIDTDRVSALVVLSLSVEVQEGQVQTVFSREPKLRDTFLQVLFDHANVGGFDGAFTNSNTMDVLRRSLLEASYHAVGDLVTDVLITEIVRQDV